MQTNIKGQRVVKIASVVECGEESVYNMEVADNHNFAINGGVVVHNCMDSMRYFVKTQQLARVRRKIERPKGYGLYAGL